MRIPTGAGRQLGRAALAHAWRAGTPTSPGCGSSHRRPSPTPAACWPRPRQPDPVLIFEQIGAVRGVGRAARRRRPGRPRPRRGAPGRHGRHAGRLRRIAGPGPRRGRAARRRRRRRRGRSTCARCARWTSGPCSSRWPAPTGSSWSTTRGAPAASAAEVARPGGRGRALRPRRPRRARVRGRGARCPTRATWRRRRCPAPDDVTAAVRRAVG